MIELQAVLERLDGVEASIARHARGTSQHISKAESLVIRSLEKRRDELRQELEAITSANLVDLCDYRIMPNQQGRYPVRLVSDALHGWQDMVTNFFGAVRDKPKERALFSPDIIAASTLNVGYTYPGSLGFVLFVPNDQFLPSETDLDIAVQGIVDLASARDVEQVRALKLRFGKSSIRSFYKWAGAHIEGEFDADVTWKRGDVNKVERVIQIVELKTVRSLIDAASDKEESLHEFPGILSALDIPKRTFGFATSQTNEFVRGFLDAQFDTNVERHVPGEYRAVLRRVMVQRLYTEEDIPTWTLIDLKPPAP